MKRKPAKRKTIVGVLTAPDPRFVSLVDHGANQRPFHATKRHQKKDDPMPNQTKIHRVTFTGEHFTTEDAVKSFLVAGGFTDFTVQKSDDGFYVEDVPADQFDGELRTVPHSSAKGVSYIAGDVSEAKAAEIDAAKAAETDNGQGDGDKSQKSDDAETGKEGAAKDATEAQDAADGDNAKKSEAAPAPGAESKPRVRVRRGLMVANKSVASVVSGHEDMADAVHAMDGLTAKSFADMLENYSGSMPPGMYDLADAMMGEMRKMFKSGDVNSDVVAKLANDFTGAALKFFEVYQDVLANKDAAAKSEDGLSLLDELAAMLFAPTDKSADASKEVAGLVAQVASLTKALGDTQQRLDQLVLEGDTTSKSLGGARTVASRKSTDADEGGETAQKAVDAADKAEADEMRSRTVKRLFGRRVNV